MSILDSCRLERRYFAERKRINVFGIDIEIRDLEIPCLPRSEVVNVRQARPDDRAREIVELSLDLSVANRTVRNVRRITADADVAELGFEPAVIGDFEAALGERVAPLPLRGRRRRRRRWLRRLVIDIVRASTPAPSSAVATAADALAADTAAGFGFGDTGDGTQSH